MDRQDIECTTYQMRNMYAQMSDGFFKVLDVMNYIQHHQVVRLCRAHDSVLDICCGRGLLLPMLRYQRPNITCYVGVDIKPSNAVYLRKRANNNKPIEDPYDYYPFHTYFKAGNVAEMDQFLPNDSFTMLVYTASIEHMHKDAGMASLRAARKVAKKGARLVITCPRTPEDKDGYDTQYAAHVYEWKRSELIAGLEDASWRIQDEWGLLVNWKALEPLLSEDEYELITTIKRYVPTEWWTPVVAAAFPDAAKEIGFLCEAV
jgi:SAM-dependent methyltransferase